MHSGTAGADPERNPVLTGAPVSEGKLKQQLPPDIQSCPLPPCESVSQGVPQGVLQSQLNQHNEPHPHSHTTDREQLLQIQVKQLQKALHEQTALLNLLSPGEPKRRGLVLSPAFLTQYQAYSLSQDPETGPLKLFPTDSAGDWRERVSNTVEAEQQVLACIPQQTRSTDNTSLQTVTPEQRCLSPIKEESCEPWEELCTLSPFGVRRKVPANPEERPIQPGLKETEKTFEDFVEEQLKLDDEALKKNMKQLRTSERRNFLRKGDGRSRISISKDNKVQKIQPASKSATSTQLQRPSTPSPLQHNDRSKVLISHPHPPQCNSTAREKMLMRNGKAMCSDQKSSQKNLVKNIVNIPAHDGKSLARDLDKHSSPKHKELSEQPNELQSTQSNNECVIGSCLNIAPKIHLLEERVGFKKVNDRIVRVCALDKANTKTLSLTTEIKQLLFHGDITDHLVDDPKPPTRLRPLRKNSDHMQDLSDEDYASDAPSDAGPSEYPQSPQSFLTRVSSSSTSDDGTDSELHQISWSESSEPSRSRQKNGAEAEPHGACSSDLLTRIFPKVKCVGKTQTDNELWENASRTQHSVSGSEPPTKVQQRTLKGGASNDLMMDKMKTEQDRALSFIRSEMDHFSKNDKDSMQNGKSTDSTPPHVMQHLHEAEDLREQIQSLREQLKRRECEWWQAHSELQGRVDALTRENHALMNHSVIQVRSQSSERSATHPDAQNQTRRHSVRNSQDKNEEEFLSARRSSRSNSRTSTASQSLEDSDPIPYSEYGEKVSCRSAERRIRSVSRNAMPKGLQGAVKSGKSVSSESDYGSTEMIEDLFQSESKPKSTQSSTKAVVREETRYPDGKVEQLLMDGSRVIVFHNGTRKEIGADQKSVTVTFFNGDVKRILADGTMVYYYCDTQTTHSTYPSGLEVLQFPNKQREKHHPDGTREILFPDGTIKTMYPDGRQESYFPDGTIVKLSKNGEKAVELTNGQREIHTSQYKQRIYPDGTVKTVYLNGKQETKYSSGTIHIKYNDDAIMMDRK